MPRQIGKGDRLILIIPFNQAKQYQEYAKAKGTSLSNIVLSLLQAETGDKSKITIRVPRLSTVSFFNNSQKTEFIKTIGSELIRRHAASLFFKANPTEQNLNLDLSEWADEPLYQFLKAIEQDVGGKTFRIYRRVVKLYLSWLRKQGKPYSDSIFFIDKELL